VAPNQAELFFQLLRNNVCRSALQPLVEVEMFSLVNIRPFVNTGWVTKAIFPWVVDTPLSRAPSPGKTIQMRAANRQRKAILYVTDM
jgi:hypothetical protein